MRSFQVMTAAGAVLLMVAAAAAHVFWIQPASFRPAPGTAVKIGLRVGDAFPGDVVPRNEKRIVRFAAWGAEGERPVVGQDGSATAGFARFKAAGTEVIGYASDRAFVELEAAKFESYLKDKGLEKIAALRADRGEIGKAVREAYSRCAKAVLSVGGKAGPGFDRVVGMKLELIPELDPGAMKAGEDMRVRVEFEGKPLAGALVEARHPASPEAKVSGRTGADGRVTLRLEGAGMWVIDTVEMTGAGAGEGVDWESVWASLSFEIDGNSAAAGAGRGSDVAAGR